MVGFCETADVREALQKASSGFGSGPTATGIVEAAIEGASQWFANQTNTYWFDSNKTANDLTPTATTSATNVRLDVPSSPHRQDRQLFASHQGARYPVSHYGPYARVKLPHAYVSSVTVLEVRDRGGGTTDWVADGDFTEGRGDEYYIERKGQDSYGRTYLYVDASAIGPRVDFTGLLTVDYDYGLDYQTTAWDDVKVGIANLAAAHVVDDDNVLAQIQDAGQLISVQTQHQNLLDTADRYLGPYLSAVSD